MSEEQIYLMKKNNPDITNEEAYKAHMFNCPKCNNILIQDWVDKTLASCYDRDGCNKSYWLKEVKKND